MVKKKLKIGVDIDGVLIDTDSRAYLEFCERELGWNIDYELYTKTHSWFDATGQSSTDSMGEAFGRFLTETEESQKPIEGAHDALKVLSQFADIFLITARVGELQKVTEDFLQAHLKDVRYKEISMGNTDRKSTPIAQFGLDYFIDDSYREISQILQNELVTTKLIPFPAFHGLPRWSEIQDERIIWLSVWKNLALGMTEEEQASIREQAWQEIKELASNKN